MSRLYLNYGENVLWTWYTILKTFEKALDKNISVMQIYMSSWEVSSNWRVSRNNVLSFTWRRYYTTVKFGGFFAAESLSSAIELNSVLSVQMAFVNKYLTFFFLLLFLICYMFQLEWTYLFTKLVVVVCTWSPLKKLYKAWG